MPRTRLAVFTSQFPGRINTFFARDMRALIDAGIDLDIFPLYPVDDRFWDAVPECLHEGVLPRSRVHGVGAAAALRGGSLRECARAASDLLRVTSSSLRYGVGPAAKTVCAVARAWAWSRTNHARFDHVLAYWGNYSATAAYVFHRLCGGDAPFSMFLHAGTDLYRQQTFLLEKLVYADNVFVVCEFNRRFLAALYPAQFPRISHKILLHHLPIDLAEYGFTRAGRDRSRVIAVGSLEPAKGYVTLLRAAERVAAVLPDLNVTFVGDGRQRRTLERLADALGIRNHVTFAGWQTPAQVRRAIGAATILVHPSAGLGDAVPTVIKEALALGTPVIASDVAGIPELLDRGRSGVLVPPADVDALAAAITELLKSPARLDALAAAGRAHAEAAFDIRRNGPRLGSLIQETPQRSARAGSARACVGDPAVIR